MKKILSAIAFIFIFIHEGYSCAVCLGDFTENEIIAYSFSVLFMIGILFALIYLLFKKVIKNYDLN